MKTYALHPKGHDLIDITPNGPVFGELTITDEIDRNVQPHPMQKCIVVFYDEEARRHWGETREIWVQESGDALMLALAHLNGQA